ncbi:MAG: hypothetical protein KDE58_14215 [Caldilineaceae bacterium]|nr:hypothetical protein [Caldilineaceae bacterium]
MFLPKHLLPITIVVGILALALSIFFPRYFAPLTATAQNAQSPTPLLRGTATPILRGTATPQVRSTPNATATATLRPIPSPSPTPAGEHYQIGQSVTSEQLPAIALTVRRATLTDTALILTLAFENRTDDAVRFSFITAVEQRRLQLLDGNDQSHPATAVDQSWAAIQPEDGFVAGGANVGVVTFARPLGPGPYQLVGIFDYPPVTFNLATATSAPPSSVVPTGTYPVDVTLFSNDEVLEPLRLSVDAVTVTADTLSFQVAIINTNYLSYGLQRGPTGMDATLLDAERRQSAPLTVSPSLASGITPVEGIPPGERHIGTITFARPTDLATAHFVFPRYSSLTLRFDSNGLQSSQLTAGENGAVPPTPTPQPDIARYHELTALLDQLASALLAGDRERFSQGLTLSLQPTVATAFGRLSQMPLATATFTFAPGQSFEITDSAAMTDMLVLLRYTFDGVPATNFFVQDFSVDFVRQPNTSGGTTWQIDAISPMNTLPFWWAEDVVAHETTHFLIFTRFDSSDAIAVLGEEVEAAYATVSEKGLSLAARYVTYVTDPEDDFAAYTGATNPNVLGVALSRYQINQKAINVVSQAFYINGTNFVNAEQLEQRQATITHELVHLALVGAARPFTPPWLAEGLAVYYADQNTAADYDAPYNEERLSTLDLSSLTRLSSLGVHDAAGESTSYRYLYSGAVIEYLIEQYGEAQVLAFYRSYAEVPAAEIQDRLPLFSSQPSQDRVFQMMSVEVTEKALDTFFGLTLSELDSAVKAWLRNPDRSE